MLKIIRKNSRSLKFNERKIKYTEMSRGSGRLQFNQP